MGKEIEKAMSDAQDLRRYMDITFKKYYKAWNGKNDDRQIFCNDFELIHEAIDEMEKITNNIIWCGFYSQFTEREETMLEIRDRFTNGKCASAE